MGRTMGGVRIPTGAKDFSVLQDIQTGCGHRSLLFNGKVDQSPSTNTEVNNEWSYTATPIRLHDRQGKFASTFTVAKPVIII